MDFPILSTPRLILRAMTPDDAPALCRLLSIPVVTLHSNWPDAPSDKDVAEIAGSLADLHSSGSGCSWTIAANGSDDVVGFIRFNYINSHHRSGGIGYESYPEYWGRGLMTEAVRAVVACGHDRLSINRIEAWTLPGNGGSDRVLEKSGFRHEGTLRQSRWFKGAFHDLRWFGRVASDPRD